MPIDGLQINVTHHPDDWPASRCTAMALTFMRSVNKHLTPLITNSYDNEGTIVSLLLNFYIIQDALGSILNNLLQKTASVSVQCGL